MKKTTRQQFKLFRDECIRLGKRWELTGWDLYVHIGHFENDAVWAELSTNLCQRAFNIKLADNLGGESNVDILAIARHEMVHALCEPLGTMAMNRYVTKNEIDEACHEVLCRLINFLPK